MPRTDPDLGDHRAENDPSLRLAGKLGFEYMGDTLYNSEPTIVLRRPPWK